MQEPNVFETLFSVVLRQEEKIAKLEMRIASLEEKIKSQTITSTPYFPTSWSNDGTSTKEDDETEKKKAEKAENMSRRILAEYMQEAPEIIDQILGAEDKE